MQLIHSRPETALMETTGWLSSHSPCSCPLEVSASSWRSVIDWIHGMGLHPDIASKSNTTTIILSVSSKINKTSSSRKIIMPRVVYDPIIVQKDAIVMWQREEAPPANLCKQPIIKRPWNLWTIMMLTQLKLRVALSMKMLPLVRLFKIKVIVWMAPKDIIYLGKSSRGPAKTIVAVCIWLAKALTDRTKMFSWPIWSNQTAI